MDRLIHFKNKLKIAVLLIGIVILAPSAFAAVFMDSQGQKVDTAGWRGKWVIINYWAAWCDACLEEIPQLNAFYDSHHQKDKIVLIGVNDDDLPLNQLKLAIQAVKIRFPVLQTDPAKELGLRSIAVLPTTFIINPQGKVVKELFGPQTVESLERLTQ